MAFLGVLSFFLLTAISTVVNAEICPFNNECECLITNRNVDNEFTAVDCKPGNGNLPAFIPHPVAGVKYNVTSQFDITADVSSIPANHFAAFGAIVALKLQTEQTKTQNWDPKAFGEVNIKMLYASGLDNMIPIPQAVINVPTITRLSIGKGSPFELAANTFASLPNLDTIYITNNEVTRIDPNAFDGLAKLRTYFQSYYPTDENLRDLKVALNKADKLEQLSFDAAKFTHYDLATFSDIPTTKLKIYTTNNNLTNITTSNPNKFPRNSKIWFLDSEVDSIDESIEALMTNDAISLVVDITRIILGPCAKASWMSRLSCPAQMVIYEAQCSDGKRQVQLADYLERVDPETNCTNDRK